MPPSDTEHYFQRQRRKQLEELIGKLFPQTGPDANLLNWNLIDQALIHPSFSAQYNNDRLELLGDSVLRLAVSLYLHEQYTDRSVGDLSALRSYLVSDEHLVQIANTYELDKYILVEANSRRDQKTKRSRLADAFEALIAALYLSTPDLHLIRSWLDAHMEQTIAQVKLIPALGNYKLALQELTQGVCKQLPEYRLISREPFTAEVWFRDQCWGRGTGQSIKTAEQSAAREALPALQTYLQGSEPNQK